MFTLRFTSNDIRYWAERYDATSDEEVERDARDGRSRGYLRRCEFMSLCKWKSPRTQGLCEKNSEELIREATRLALSASSEELRIGTLMILNGVSWPTASVILHFWHRDPYPILDFRALWSLGSDEPSSYTFDFWWKYTQFCRELAQEGGVSMRVLDRALWQFSYEKQK